MEYEEIAHSLDGNTVKGQTQIIISDHSRTANTPAPKVICLDHLLEIVWSDQPPCHQSSIWISLSCSITPPSNQLYIFLPIHSICLLCHPQKWYGSEEDYRYTCWPWDLSQWSRQTDISIWAVSLRHFLPQPQWVKCTWGAIISTAPHHTFQLQR